VKLQSNQKPKMQSNNNELDENNTSTKQVLLSGQKDVYSGVTVDLTHTSHKNQSYLTSLIDFENALVASLDDFSKKGIRGVWLKIHAQHSQLISVAIKHKFTFHHTEPDAVYLTLWIPDESIDPNKIPPYSQHYIGVAGCVVDIESRKVLLLTEKYELHQKKDNELPPWKLPGGQLDDPDETIGAAAVREVWEETGVESEFVALLAFRHMHRFRFGKSDLYFVCLCKPKDSSTLPDPNPDPHEIALCQWFDLDEYFAMTHLTRVQAEAQEAVKRYIEDPSKCMKTEDITQWKRKALMYKL
jgi:8-oxo-dGTP pyrophosphatase MutT (NUDIX family)